MAVEPNVQPVPDSTFVNPQLDSQVTGPKQKAELLSSMNSFFGELDAKVAEESPLPEEIVPPATEEPAAKEKPKPETEPEPIPVSKTPEPPEAPAAPAPAVADKPLSAPPETAESLDSLEPHPDASPETKSQFSKLKEITKGIKATASAYRNTLAPILRDLGISMGDNPEEITSTLSNLGAQIQQWRQGALSPEVQNELNSLRELSRGVGVLQSEEFKNKYHVPVTTAYHRVIDEIAKYLKADPESVKQYTEVLKNKWNPARIREADESWWDTQINSIEAPETIKQTIRNKAARVMELQEEHDRAADELTKDPATYQKWLDSTTSKYDQDYQHMVADEVQNAFKTDKAHLAVWRPQPTEGVTDPAKLAEIQKHNAYFNSLEQRFNTVIKDVKSGPRKAARYAMDFLEMQESIPQLKEAATKAGDENKALKAEIEKLKAEVTKRRKLGDAPLQSTAGTGSKPGPEPSKLPKDTRKSLDEAFKNWSPE